MTTFDSTNWRTEKILTSTQAAEKADALRAEGKKIITTNGAFDMLHVGHLDQLEEAKAQGDVLFVGINSDEAIMNEKGDSRPLIPQDARAAMLAALTCVDYVVVMDGTYNEEPMKSFLPSVKPDVHVNGPDRGEPNTWIEWPVMQELNIAGHTVAKRNDFSTSALVQKIKNSDGTT